MAQPSGSPRDRLGGGDRPPWPDGRDAFPCGSRVCGRRLAADGSRVGGDFRVSGVAVVTGESARRWCGTGAPAPTWSSGQDERATTLAGLMSTGRALGAWRTRRRQLPHQARRHRRVPAGAAWEPGSRSVPRRLGGRPHQRKPLAHHCPRQPPLWEGLPEEPGEAALWKGDQSIRSPSGAPGRFCRWTSSASMLRVIDPTTNCS